MKALRPLIIIACLVIWQSCSTKKTEEATDAAATEAADSTAAAGDAANATEAASADENASTAQGATESSSTGSGSTYVSASGRTVYLMSETKPEFVGGEKAMSSFLSKNLKYPNTDAEGTVYVGFVVGEDGSVGDVAVENGPEDEKLRAEAVRVVSQMPKWTPGQQGGTPVHVKYVLPVTFKKQ